MGLLSKLFGSQEVIDAGLKGIDALAFTQEERSKRQLEFLERYAAFKLAQRCLALLFCVPYVLAWVWYFARTHWVESQEVQAALLEGRMGDSVALIVLFYFGGGMAESIRRQFFK